VGGDWQDLTWGGGVAVKCWIESCSFVRKSWKIYPIQPRLGPRTEERETFTRLPRLLFEGCTLKECEVRKRFKDAGITLEQIVDGTTGCEIWFYINVADRKCFMSTEEHSDGSVDLILSSIEDWLTIPEDFYKLAGREVKGANACVFSSFLVGGKPQVLWEGITAQEVIDQGLFERLESNEQAVTDSAICLQAVTANTRDMRETDPKINISNQLVSDRQIFPMSKAALVSKYKAQWATIERDMQDASKNGLAVAKAGARKWSEDLALQWTRSNNKFKDRSDVGNSPQMMMTNLPTRVVNKLI
jgi:hypothetical protein